MMENCFRNVQNIRKMFTILLSLLFIIRYSKWAVTLADYPYAVYPPFINGGVQIMSRQSVRKLYYASLFTDSFK